MTRGKLLFAHLLVAAQILLAVGYYTWRTDPLDERFAWRMFSVQRFASCSIQFRIGDPPQPTKLSPVFHEAWISIARRGRREVIERMAARLCEKNPDAPVTLVATCKSIAGERALSSGSFDLCKTRRL